MEVFEYIITDKVGLHARPAGLLVKQVKEMKSRVTLKAKGKKANAENILAVMGLGVKEGERITVEMEGGNEREERRVLETFFWENL